MRQQIVQLRESKAVKDRNGSEIVDMNDRPITANKDGSINLYHGTSEKNAKAIQKTKTWRSLEQNRVFFSNFPRGGEGFGDWVIGIKINPRFTELEDAFRNGEVHLSIHIKYLRLAKIILVKKK